MLLCPPPTSRANYFKTTQEISDPVEELEGPEEVLTSDSETEEIEEHDADADADDLDDL